MIIYISLTNEARSKETLIQTTLWELLYHGKGDPKYGNKDASFNGWMPVSLFPSFSNCSAYAEYTSSKAGPKDLGGGEVYEYCGLKSGSVEQFYYAGDDDLEFLLNPGTTNGNSSFACCEWHF